MAPTSSDHQHTSSHHPPSIQELEARERADLANHIEIRETDGHLDIVRRPTAGERLKQAFLVASSGLSLIVAFLAVVAIYEVAIGRYVESGWVDTLEMASLFVCPALMIALCVYAIGVATLKRQHMRIEGEGARRSIVTTYEPFDEEDVRSLEVDAIDSLFLREEKVPKQKARSYGLLSPSFNKHLPEHDRKYHLKAQCADGEERLVREDIVPRANALAQQRLLASYLDLDTRDEIVDDRKSLV